MKGIFVIMLSVLLSTSCFAKQGVKNDFIIHKEIIIKTEAKPDKKREKIEEYNKFPNLEMVKTRSSNEIWGAYLIVWHSDNKDIKLFNEQLSHLKPYMGQDDVLISMPSVNNIIVLSSEETSKKIYGLLDKEYIPSMTKPIVIHLDNQGSLPVVFRTPIKSLLSDVEKLSEAILSINTPSKIKIKADKEIIRYTTSYNKAELINMLATPPYNKRYDF